MCEKRLISAPLRRSDIQSCSPSLQAGCTPEFLWSCFARLGDSNMTHNWMQRCPGNRVLPSLRHDRAGVDEWVCVCVWGVLDAAGEQWDWGGCIWFIFAAFNCLFLTQITGTLYLFTLPAPYVLLWLGIHVPSQSSVTLMVRDRELQLPRRGFIYYSKYGLN